MCLLSIKYPVYAHFYYNTEDESNTFVIADGKFDTFSDAKKAADKSSFLNDKASAKNKLKYIEVMEVHPHKDGITIYKVYKKDNQIIKELVI